MKLTTLLQLAGLMHVGLVWAGMTMPRTVGLAGHLKPLPPFIRNLVWVYYAFIGLILISFGILTFIFADEIAAGEPVARALCILMAVFWTMRLVAALFVFDVRPYLTNWFYRAGYQATNVAFAYLVGIYIWAAWKGGAL
jgi:FtsH-binding integral membrane protein